MVIVMVIVLLLPCSCSCHYTDAANATANATSGGAETKSVLPPKNSHRDHAGERERRSYRQQEPSIFCCASTTRLVSRHAATSTVTVGSVMLRALADRQLHIEAQGTWTWDSTGIEGPRHRNFTARVCGGENRRFEAIVKLWRGRNEHSRQAPRW